MKTTVNELVQEFKEIANSHLQINNFFWGDFGKAAKRNDLNYPLLGAYFPSGTVFNNQTGLNLIVYVADKIDKGNNDNQNNPAQGNLTEVESDTMQVMRDVYNIINKSFRWQRIGKVQQADYTKFIERGDDETAGTALNITFFLRDTTSICNLPMEGYDFDKTPTTETVDIYVDGVFIESIPCGGSYNFTT